MNTTPTASNPLAPLFATLAVPPLRLRPPSDPEDAAMLRKLQLQQLRNTEAQLQAQLNDVRERITYLTDPNYLRFPGTE